MVLIALLIGYHKKPTAATEQLLETNVCNLGKGML